MTGISVPNNQLSTRARVRGQAHHWLPFEETHEWLVMEVVTALVINGILEGTSRNPSPFFQ